MKERPILFSGPMVRAILEGRKTQMRRSVEPQPQHVWGQLAFKKRRKDGGSLLWPNCGDVLLGELCPYGVPGDRLWVRESIAVNAINYASTKEGLAESDPLSVWYLADGPKRSWCDKTLTARFMPRWASRITLEINEVRVQPVQEITADDCAAEGSQYPVTTEGCPAGKCSPLLAIGDKFAAYNYLDRKDKDLHQAYSRAYFASLWDSINAKRGFGWDVNPWVWAITFRRVQP